MPVKIHGKDYKTVAERLNDLNKKYPKYSLNTDIVSMEGTRVVVKATIDIEEKGVFSGHAYEDESKGRINSTSHIENAETSAIGRALASAGFGGTEFASADELANALHQQKYNSSPGIKISHASQSDYEIKGGKYQGKKISEISDSGYLSWLVKQDADEWVKDLANKRITELNK